MPRKRQETNRTKIARMLIEEYKPNTVKDIQDAIKDLSRRYTRNNAKKRIR